MRKFDSNHWIRDFMFVSCGISLCVVYAGSAPAAQKPPTFEQQQQVRDKAATNGLSKGEELDLLQKRTQAAEDAEDRRNWHFSDYMDDLLFEDDAKPETPVQYKKDEFNVMKSRDASIDANIDKQLKDALEKAKK